MPLLDDVDTELAKSYRHVWHRAGYDPWMPGKEHVPQQKFHESNATVRAVVSGRAGGKTFAGAAESVRYLMENPGSKMLVLSPTYPMLETATKLEFLHFMPDEAVEYYSKGRNEMHLKNGSMVWFRSLDDPDKQVRGQTVAAIWIDEAAYVTEHAWKVAIACLRQPGYDQKVWVTTTPKGFNWVFERIVQRKQQNPEDERYWYIQFRTTDNPWLTAETLEFLHDEYGGGEWGRQELGGEFVSLSGTIYKAYSDMTHTGRFRETEYESMLYGVDFGFGVSDFVIVAIGVDGSDRMHVVDETRSLGLDTEAMIATCQSMYDRYGKGPMYCDPSEPQSIADLQKNSMQAYKAPNAVIPGIQRVASRLEPRDDDTPRLRFDERCVEIISDIKMYHWKETKDGQVVKDQPDKTAGVDHSMDALRYAVMGYDDGKSRSLGMVRNKVLDDIL